jgi:hypothetical protein
MRSINTSLSPQEVKRDQNDAGAVILQKQSLGPKDTKAVPLAGTNQDRIAQLVDARQLAAQQIHTKQIGAEETGRGSPRERLLLLYDDMAFRQSRANAHAMLKADPPPQTFQEKRQWEAEKAKERRSEPTGMHGSAQKRWIAETQTLQADLQGIMRDIQSAVEQRVRDQVVSEVLQELIGKAITQAEQAAGAQFTCFTSRKVHKLTPQKKRANKTQRQVLLRPPPPRPRMTRKLVVLLLLLEAQAPTTKKALVLQHLGRRRKRCCT